ncbi:MAG TPA: hypothetical protein PKD83_06100 [Ignavibacteria bacterium]|nr:hypothetical protein [Ignavibacteria bacterium]
MNRILIIIFLALLTAEISVAQNIHKAEDFKLFNIKNIVSPNRNSEKDNSLNSAVEVIPNNSSTPISNFITDILLNGDTVWFATGSGLMRTVNNFSSYQYYYGLAPFGTDDIAGFNLNKSIIVASSAISEEISGSSVPTGTGIKVSTDFGLSWSSYPQPVDSRGDSTIIYGQDTLYALPVVVRQQNLSYDIAITRTKNDLNNYTIWICCFAGGLRKSTDYGVTWERVLLPPDNLDSINVNTGGYTFSLNPRDPPQGNLNHRVFSITAVNDSTLYVGTAGGINKSTSWGVNWTKYNNLNTGNPSSGNPNGISGNFVVNLEVQKYNGKEIIWGATRQAQAQNEFDALSYTSNGGANWFNTLDEIKPNGISFKDSIVYALTDAGLWRAVYGNFNWSKSGTIYDERTRDQLRTTLFYSGNHIGDTLFFGSADGLLSTVEYGQPWIGKWKIIRAVSPIDLSSDIKTYAAPNPFAPDDEVTRFYYKSDKPSSKITIKIFDFGMNPVRTVIQNATRLGTDVLYTSWDGKNDNGYIAANGVYFYRVEFDNEDPVWGKVILLQ